MTGQHDRRDLGDLRVAVGPKLFQHLGAIQSGHFKVEQQKRRLLTTNQIQRLDPAVAFRTTIAG